MYAETMALPPELIEAARRAALAKKKAAKAAAAEGKPTPANGKSAAPKKGAAKAKR